jgi:DNA-binding transcriptional MerR regulator
MSDSLNKRYYKISEVADLLSVPASTLRFWENKFTIIKPRRSEHGIRYYTPNDIETIRMIYFLVKEKGLKIDAAQAEIRRNRSGVSRRYEAIARLRKIKTELTSLIAAIDQRRL